MRETGARVRAVEPPRLAVLLGAGASVDAGIPTSVGMVDAVIARLRPDQARVVEFVRHTLAAHQAQQRPRLTLGQEWAPDVAVDVERLFTAVETLAEREIHPWSPFVASWHPGLEAFASLAAAGPSATWGLERALGRLGSDHFSTQNIAKEVLQLVQRAQTRSDVGKLLSAARHDMLLSLFQVLEIADVEAAAYLKPLVTVAQDQGALTVATLNYDRVVEDVAESMGVGCGTGIETWLTSGSLDWRDDGLSLFKLHGSIDWVLEPPDRNDGGIPLQRIRKVGREEKEIRAAPAVIFGEAGKLRADGPYLELLLAWSIELQEADVLLAVGYSFRDVHVNELIARWFNGGSSRRLVVLDPGEVGANAPKELRAAFRLLTDPQWIARTGRSQRVMHVRASAREGLEDAIQASLEAHQTAQPMDS